MGETLGWVATLNLFLGSPAIRTRLKQRVSGTVMVH